MPRNKRSSKYAISGSLGVELACSRCQVVLQTATDEGNDLPRHRCAATGKAADFDIVLELDEVTDSKRVDSYWFGEYIQTDF